MFKAQLNTNTLKNKVDKNIYGHFSEHLGRCIYGGLYVGNDSDIPNVEGMRKDVLEASKSPFYVGPAVALPMNITGKTVSVPKRKDPQ